jgi:hypothetical protein
MAWGMPSCCWLWCDRDYLDDDVDGALSIGTAQTRGAYKCVYVSHFIHRGASLFCPPAFGLAKPGLMNMFPLT